MTRRWLLTTKAMAWLSEALRHSWTDVRPQDLACFAFAALSPAWPRRTLAVSHRSSDAKQLLGSLQMWNTPHVVIDANYIPVWETNVGMIWSLFAAVPTLVPATRPATSSPSGAAASSKSSTSLRRKPTSSMAEPSSTSTSPTSTLSTRTCSK